MREREERMKKIRSKANNVEDELFSDFCDEINVDNIRQYEERELQVQEERAKKRMDFENQKLRLVNQLEFEKSKDTMGMLYSCINLVISSTCAWLVQRFTLGGVE